VELRLGDLLEPLGAERFHVLVSNPPYVREGEREDLQAEVRDFEPGGALFAGPDGLSVIRPLVAGAGEVLLSGGLLALEVGAGQTEEVSSLVVETGAFDAPRVHKDLAGRARIVTALRRG
jgi:release factor glutamine methyltransferase